MHIGGSENMSPRRGLGMVETPNSCFFCRRLFRSNCWEFDHGETKSTGRVVMPGDNEYAVRTTPCWPLVMMKKLPISLRGTHSALIGGTWATQVSRMIISWTRQWPTLFSALAVGVQALILRIHAAFRPSRITNPGLDARPYTAKRAVHNPRHSVRSDLQS